MAHNNLESGSHPYSWRVSFEISHEEPIESKTQLSSSIFELKTYLDTLFKATDDLKDEPCDEVMARVNLAARNELDNMELESAQTAVRLDALRGSSTGVALIFFFFWMSSPDFQVVIGAGVRSIRGDIFALSKMKTEAEQIFQCSQVFINASISFE